MSTLSATAPGKAIIAGEYSVLFGGKCLVLATNRLAEASCAPGKNWAFSARTSHGWQSNTEHELFVAVSRTAKGLGLTPTPGAYRVDTSAFYNPQSRHKLGLGSSAAATVALCKLFLGPKDCQDLSVLLNFALVAHRDFSAGLGSGADVAAAVYGGLILFANTPKGPLIQQADLPWWPELIWVDTGRSQNTRPFVTKVLSFAEQEPDFITELVAQSDSCCAKLLGPLPEDHLSSTLSELFALMSELGARCKLDIISSEHQHIHDLARSMGGSSKPSGAGGGDLSLALVPKTKRHSFITQLQSLGWPVFSRI